MTDDQLMPYPSVHADLIVDLRDPDQLFDFAASLARAHAASLVGSPAVRVITVPPAACPRCGGRVVFAVDDPASARCCAGCGSSVRRFS